jgi:hypothetical protein
VAVRLGVTDELGVREEETDGDAGVAHTPSSEVPSAVVDS